MHVCGRNFNLSSLHVDLHALVYCELTCKLTSSQLIIAFAVSLIRDVLQTCTVSSAVWCLGAHDLCTKGDSWLIKGSVWRLVATSSLMNLLVAFEQQSKVTCRVEAEHKTCLLQVVVLAVVVRGLHLLTTPPPHTDHSPSSC